VLASRSGGLADGAGQYPSAEEAEQRGDQRQCDQYGKSHGARATQARLGQFGDPDDPSPTRAMKTVAPAKTTADPAAPTARPARGHLRLAVPA
jgi:hypothetical protein